MADYVVVADYRFAPSEGMQVVSRTLVDGLRSSGHGVEVVPPKGLGRALIRLVLRRQAGTIVFTHGPGAGVVLASLLLRRATKAQIVWVATRPELGNVPRVLRGHRTAHLVVCNRPNRELESVARDAIMRQQFIGIDPARLAPHASESPRHTGTSLAGAPTAIHMGHLRRNRGLDLLVALKAACGERLNVLVYGSPTFEPDPRVVEELETAGVVVRREYVPSVGALYRAADLYLFTARPEEAGAVELPLGVLEAVACGCPVVTTDFGAIRPALEGVDGVEVVSPARFVDTVTRLLDRSPREWARPEGLPLSLHAHRITDAVMNAAGAH